MAINREYKDISNKELIEKLLGTFLDMGAAKDIHDISLSLQFVELKTELEIRLEERDIYKEHSNKVKERLLNYEHKKSS